MLDKILKGVIIVAIISRTSLLLSNYGQNPDDPDYKGKKFTNASTLALAYITVRLQKEEEKEDKKWTFCLNQ